MAWMVREDQLDADQKDFINYESKKSGNIWVQGFAGSGKSVLLVHALKNIKRNEPNAKMIVVVYTHSLIDMFKTGLSELGISSVPVVTYIDFVEKRTEQYDYIFCDEVQDLPAKVLTTMYSRARKVIVAGDANQSIYESDPRWNESVVSTYQIGSILNARPFALSTIHRLTKSIISAVQQILPSMNIWGAKRDMTKQDVNIRLCEGNSISEEVKYVYKEALKGANVGETSAILLPSANAIITFINNLLSAEGKSTWSETKNRWGKPDYEDLNNHLSNKGIKIEFIGSGYGSLESAKRNNRIILMTYHSSKGLDFDNVFLPSLNSDFYLKASSASVLFMVAMTRSRKNLYLSYCGQPYSLVNKIKGECSKVSMSGSNYSNHYSDFDF